MDKKSDLNENENITNSAYVKYITGIAYHSLLPVSYSIEDFEKKDEKNIIKKDDTLNNLLNKLIEYYQDNIIDNINELDNNKKIKEKLQKISNKECLSSISEKIILNEEEYALLKKIIENKDKYFKEIFIIYMVKISIEIDEENKILKKELIKMKNENKINFILNKK